MIPGTWCLLLVTIGLSSWCCRSVLGPDSTYTAAVYEHRVVLNPDPRVPLSRHAALQHLQQNLDVYEEQAARAALQGAHILVFPEDGLQGFNFTRSSILGYLEAVPDPEKESWNPCVEPERYSNTEVQRRLSCMAQKHNLFLVANMASVSHCSGNSDCPPDGQWHFNTNVVYRSDGLLVARYNKQNLYFEDAFDSPLDTNVVTFDTPFAGKFGLITCFDILFHHPTVTLLEKGVRQLIFPTAWMNQLPLLDTIQFQRAFSLGAKVTLLAANIRNDQLLMTGSGLYSPSSAVYHHAQTGEPEEGRLLVATMPVLESVLETQSGGCSRGVVSNTVGQGTEDFCHRDGCSPYSFTSSMMHDPFTFVQLTQAEGQLSVCNSLFCCWLQYHRSPDSNNTELYALGAFAGTHTVNGRYSLQVCALVKCAGSEASSCGQEVVEAHAKIDFVLEGEFSTKHVYPHVLSSGYLLEQPQQVERTAQGTVTMAHSQMRAGLVTAALYGRMYHRDQL